MQLEGYEFKMTTKSTVWHFSARGSHFRDEAKDNFNSRSQRQIQSEQVNEYSSMVMLVVNTILEKARIYITNSRSSKNRSYYDPNSMVERYFLKSF